MNKGITLSLTRARSLAALLASALLFVGLSWTAHVEAQGGAPSVQARSEPHLGWFLTTGDGMTLYTYRRDTPGTSTCTGSCARNFPPYLVNGEPIIPPELTGVFGVVVRADGNRQLTYNGWPLYRWRNDRAPGDVFGQGQSGLWNVANLSPTVQIRTHPQLGTILTGPTGMTLYTFAHETATFACEDGCAENWPPLLIAFEPVAPAGLPGQLGVVQRRPGEHRGARLQVSYQGQPLYYWSRDQRPGDAFGEGIGGIWRVARP